MGRESGYLALMSSIAGGAEAAIVPEFEPRPEALLSFLKKAYEQGKSHFIVVVAEGAPLSAEELHEYINESKGTYDSRLTVVGHIQRGGIPTASDRILASRLGSAAVEALADGETGVMVGMRASASSACRSERWLAKSNPWTPISTGWPRSWPNCLSKPSGSGYIFPNGRKLLRRTTCRNEVSSGSKRGRRTVARSAASPMW
jgi:6-phosphofructokinase